MSEHERLREWLALAAADALDAEERRELDRHLAGCRDCAAEFERWASLAGWLKCLPTPQAPAQLIERVRARIGELAVARAERQIDQRTLVWLVVFSWTVTVASWPVVRLVSQGMASWLDVGFVHTWFWMVGFTAVSWLGAAVAAAMLAIRQRPARRML
ncbi:MAG TPA: zf-HC2 domain-containing protein [Candidatus Acidoferrales bacterium]|nr:zf-HC2 domain-containing protein [Candidatus Acidoferrales bacterium]